jgi:exocyst complex protein 7
MATNGEERVLITAQQIVRSLGTTDTVMTDDMLQILSNFDHRFSSMNDKPKKLEFCTSHEVGTTATDEDLQLKRSRPSSRGASNSKMIESRFDHAKDVVVRWHLGYLEQAKQQRIFECLEEEASTYLEAVDEVQNLLDQLSVQKEEEQQPATLVRAQNVIQLAMGRLEEEFCHLLAQNSRYVDPNWLFDSMAVVGSFRSSFNDDHHHTVDDAAIALKISSFGEEDAAGDARESG